jgi:hypothetical protein
MVYHHSFLPRAELATSVIGLNFLPVSRVLPSFLFHSFFFFHRHYRSLLRLARPEQLLGRVRGDRCTTMFHLWGDSIRVADAPTFPALTPFPAPFFVLEEVDPSTNSSVWYSVTRRKIRSLSPLVQFCLPGVSIGASWAPVILGSSLNLVPGVVSPGGAFLAPYHFRTAGHLSVGCWNASPLGSGFYSFQLSLELSSVGFIRSFTIFLIINLFVTCLMFRLKICHIHFRKKEWITLELKPSYKI